MIFKIDRGWCFSVWMHTCSFLVFRCTAAHVFRCVCFRLSVCRLSAVGCFICSLSVCRSVCWSACWSAPVHTLIRLFDASGCRLSVVGCLLSVCICLFAVDIMRILHSCFNLSVYVCICLHLMCSPDVFGYFRLLQFLFGLCALVPRL